MKPTDVHARIVRFDEKTVTVKMMDDSWIINRCVSEAPFTPRPGVVWSYRDRCSRLLIPGDEYEQTMRHFRDAYGNAAVIAWDGGTVLGHIIFVPKPEARRRKMLFHERMPVSPDDDRTLVVQAVGFCSIGGQEYRGRGIGRTMAELMIEWAAANEWLKFQIFGVPSGLFPGHWMDSCMPPKPFWLKFGFEGIGRTKAERTWEEMKAANLGDDPRNSKDEMSRKKEAIAEVERGEIPEDEWAYEFDLERSLTAR